MTAATESASTGTPAVDELVARYAPLGVKIRRRRRLQRASAVAAAVIAIVISASIMVSDELRPHGDTGPGVERAAGMSAEELAQLAAERAAVDAKLAGLEAQIAGTQTQSQELELRLASFEAQALRLASLIDDMAFDQASPDDGQRQETQLDEEIAAMAEQRRALEKRWAQFEAQGELLAMEIVAINAQRKELESQRELIQFQRKQLADMLKQAEALYRRNARAAGNGATDVSPEQDASTHADADDDSFIHTPNSLMVDNTELDDMRGGFSIGDGMDISFGFTQVGTINGVDQFTNSFSIDSVASGFEDVDMSNMNSVILQNGSGNFVSSSVFDSLSDSFGNVIQNSLDDQVISTTTTFDISLQNMPSALQGLAGEMALTDSLGSF